MLMNIFSALRVYASKWNPTAKRPFTPEEINAVSLAKVKNSQYGLSVEFFMKTGGTTYIPLDQNSTLVEGDVVDLTKAQVVTLSRPGDDDIYRVLI